MHWLFEHITHGWYLESTFENKVESISCSMCKDITLYANWIPNTYSVVFKGNGATTGYMDTQMYTYGVMQPLFANNFAREGYVFTGWNKKSDGSSSSYLDEQLSGKLTSKANGTVTLYAQWEKLTANHERLPLIMSDASADSLCAKKIIVDADISGNDVGLSLVKFLASFSNFSEWRTGEYNKTGVYSNTNISTICLNDFVKVTPSLSYTAIISSDDVSLNIIELDNSNSLKRK